MLRLIVYMVVYVLVVGPVVNLLLKWAEFRYSSWQSCFFRTLSIMALYYFMITSFRSVAEAVILFGSILLMDKMFSSRRDKNLEEGKDQNSQSVQDRRDPPEPPEG